MNRLARRLAGLSPEQQEHLLRAVTERCGQLDAAPLSPSQARIWFHDRLHPGRPTFTIHRAYRLQGELDARRLESALRRVVERHEPLRCSVLELRGRAIQVFEPEVRGRVLGVVELSHLGATRAEAEVARRLEAAGLTAFRLAEAPLWRFQLLRLGRREQVLSLAFHHLVMDGWSLRRLFGEVAAFYAGRPPRTPTLRYRDFLAWQQRFLASPQLEQQLESWCRRLGDAGEADAGAVPVDLPAAAATGLGSYHGFHLAAPLGRRVDELARSHRSSCFMVLLAAYAALLGRHCGLPAAGGRVVVGTPVAGRNGPDVEELVGLFVNTLALPCDLSGDPSFADLLARVRATTLEAFGEQDVPFDRLVERLQPDRDASRPPLFRNMLVLQDEATSDLELPGLVCRRVLPRRIPVEFDLTLNLRGDGAGGLAAGFEYRSDLFTAGTVERLAGRFEALLAAALDDPGLALSRLPMWAPGELQLVTGVWSREAAGPAPGAAADLDGVARHARLHPRRIALVAAGEDGEGGDVEWDYAELDRRVEALARRLGRRGVGPECVVGLLLDRSPDALVALLAVLRAGGAYLPLGVDQPSARLTRIVEEAGARWAITSRRHADALAGAPQVERLLLEEEGAGEPHDEADAAPWPAVPARAAAYVLYTSGSTGRPKGIVVPRGALAEHARAVADRFGLGPEDRVLQFAALTFDVAAEELFPTWRAGATVVLCPPQARSSLPALLAACRQARVSVLNLPSPVWHEWMARPPAGEEELTADLRLLVVGSDRVLASALRRWRQRFAERVALLDAYGPTEATVTATVYQPGELSEGGGAVVPVGRPLRHVRAYVVDRHLRPVPAGVAGELALAGDGLARGYLGLPAATAGSFVPDPFADEPGRRLYLTGDRARWLPSGNLELLGRLDDQVKVRGFRIELGEVEAALARHPSVAEAAARVWEDASGEATLAAYAVTHDGGGDRGVLLDHLRRELPPYMVPATVDLLDRLPRTDRDKVDRRRLPVPRPAEPEPEAAPATALEEVLARVWAEVLERPVAPRDDFFALGGHSLRGAQLTARVGELLGVEPTLASLFDRRTVVGMAEWMRREAAETDLEELAGVLLAAWEMSDEELENELAEVTLGAGAEGGSW